MKLHRMIVQTPQYIILYILLEENFFPTVQFSGHRHIATAPFTLRNSQVKAVKGYLTHCTPEVQSPLSPLDQLCGRAVS